MTPEEEFTSVCRERFAELCSFLTRRFPRLREANEDLVQAVCLETLTKIRRESFTPQKDWWAWLCWLATKRAIDYLRETVERQAFVRLSSRDEDSSEGPREPTDSAPSPSKILEEKERRGRQGLLFSQILEEFCRRCEAHPKMYKLKEVYERRLRGQDAAEIAAAMGIRRGLVDQDIKRARDWIAQRIRQADVDRSVFLTLYGRKPEKEVR